MNVAPEIQQLLLELQSLDQRESTLRHNRDAHPAHETVKELAGRAEDLKRAIIGQSAVIADIQREVTRISDEIEKVTARKKRQSDRVEKGEVPLRDISPLQHEIAQMEQRLTKLETDQLNCEERLEAANEATDSMKQQLEGIAADVERIKKNFMADVAEADEELRSVIAQRSELAEKIGSDLLDEYDRARKLHGALAVVEVRDGVLQGFSAEISPAELERIRLTPADQLYWTEDSAQIVIRTTAG